MYGGRRVLGRRTACRQVSSEGRLEVVSGVGTKGTSYISLSGNSLLGLDGARRLAGLLREARPPLLTSLDLR